MMRRLFRSFSHIGQLIIFGVRNLQKVSKSLIPHLIKGRSLHLLDDVISKVEGTRGYCILQSLLVADTIGCPVRTFPKPTNKDVFETILKQLLEKQFSKALKVGVSLIGWLFLRLM